MLRVELPLRYLEIDNVIYHQWPNRITKCRRLPFAPEQRQDRKMSF